MRGFGLGLGIESLYSSGGKRGWIVSLLVFCMDWLLGSKYVA